MNPKGLSKKLVVRVWVASFVAMVLTFSLFSLCLAESLEGVVVGDAISLSADVVGIDKDHRIITLKGSKGNVVDIEAGDEVRNFDQIEVGDKVNVTYYESVALYLGAPGTLPEADAAALAGRAQEGDKPAGVVAGVVDISATVKGIDMQNRELKLELPDGSEVTRKVDPSVKAFDKLKVGEIELRSGV